jgi:hypothetical protein
MAIGDFINGINSVQSAINGNVPLTQTQQDQFKSDGFLLPATFSADGTGLPSSKIPSYRDAIFRRNIITWFVPNFGIVSMYINPAHISYEHRKLITKDRTKGGFTLQYWGEELDVLNISGTTGASGIEGINVLEEIYRAEQYAFDATGLVIASNNATTDLSNTLTGLGGAIGGSVGGAVGGAVGSLLGIASPNSNLAVQNVPSMAQSAFTVEMYYNGWVFRGYFDNMTVNEKANDFLIDYQIRFIVTQRRGYRLNNFPWSKSAIDGSSQHTTPSSFSGQINSGF